METILLFGGYVQALSVARSLKECGYAVHVVANHDKIAQSSSFIDKYSDIEDINELDSVYNFLLSYIQDNTISVIIPLEDSYASILSQLKPNLEKMTGAHCAVMDWNTFSFVNNKTCLLEFCKENNIGHPRTCKIANNYQDLMLEVGFPSLIKPSFSEGAKGITLVNSLDELKTKAPDIIAQYGECSLQEYIASKDYYYNAMLYRGKDGKWGNSCIIKILRYYPISGGSSSLSVSVENPKIIQMCKELLDKLNWIGFADFDILEKEDGDYRIIEINPRVPASLRGAAISGINFPEMIVSDSMGRGIPKYQYETGKYLRFLGLDFAWFMASPNRFKCNPSWFKFFGKDIYYQDGGSKDWKAMLVYFISGIKKQLSPEFRASKKGF